MSEEVVVPSTGSIKVSKEMTIDRPGVAKTLFFFSYSGAILTSELLPILTAYANDKLIEIRPPTRIGAASFRPTPQLSLFNFSDFFKSEDVPPRFPLQIATFPSINTEAGSAFDVWFGPAERAPKNGPKLPPDTLIVELEGSESPNHHKVVSEYFIEPLLDWLRVLSKQWWIGRSIEGASGGLHFIVPLNEKHEMVGSPSPLMQFASATPQMRPVDKEIWTKAADNSFGNKRPPAEDSLEMDANYMIASREFRSGIILACSAIEAARDNALDRNKKKLSDLRTSTTDLLKHLSVGLDKALGRNLKTEHADLFDTLTAFWKARGEAAHGKAVFWRMGESVDRIEDIEFGVLSNSLNRILRWISAL